MNWFYAKNGSQQGPLPTEDMKSRIAAGEIAATDLAWCEGMADWMPVSEIEQLKPAPVPPAAASAPTPEAAPAPTTMAPAAATTPVESPYQAPSATPPAAGAAPLAPGQAPGQGLAVGSMICGILSLVICCTGFLSSPLGIVAIVLGIVALSKIKRDPQRYAGGGLAKTGLVTGLLGLIASIIMGALGLWVATLTPEEVEEKIISLVPEEQRQEVREKMQEAREKQAQ